MTYLQEIASAWWQWTAPMSVQRLQERSPSTRNGPRRLVTTALCGTLLLCCVPLAAAPTMSMAALAGLPGCLQMRNLVYGMLGEHADDGS